MRESGRGQTEPVAALTAVSLVALSLSLYGVVVLDVLDQDTDRQLADPTLQQTWVEIRDGSTYDDTSSDDLEAKLVEAVESGAPFPSGYTVYVELEYLDDTATRTTVDSATFAFESATNPPWKPVGSPGSRPEQADTATRPVPIQVAPGDVRTGTLRVEVWS